MSKRSSLIIVKPGMAASTGKEFLAYAKANPGKVNYGTSGSGGSVHLAGEWLASAAGVKFTFVHYKGGNQMYVDLMADRIDVVSSSPQSTLPMLKSGKVKAVGVTGAERVPMFPDIPTMAEQGAHGFDYTYWIAFIAPAGVPPAIVARLNSEMAKVARDPAIVKKLAAEGNQAVGGTPDALRQHLASEISRWRKVVDEAGITVEP
jgi:tripartite-type tricarboxylate transporter receptor subunit TctC